MTPTSFMYAAGAAHPHKKPSSAFLVSVAEGRVEAAVDSEVLQEILHRYRAIGRWSDGRRVYDAARLIVPLTLSVTAEVVDVARRLLDEYHRLSARDALHAAVALNHDIHTLCSYDRDFDQVEGIERIEPGD